MIAIYDTDDEVERLRKRLERERHTREEAEAIAELGSRQLYDRAREMQLLYTIADASSGTTSVEAAMQIALDEMCAFTGWPIGHAYLVTNHEVHVLVPTKLWHLDHGEHFTAFREVTEKMKFRRGEGLPGRVLETGKPVWVRDVTEDDNFPRAAWAREAGVRGAFAVPVLADNVVVAVLEFFARNVAMPEENWLDVATRVGAQIGRTFEREARCEADRANRAKSEFLSRMSHELRTPLNAVLGFGQLLEMDDLKDHQRDFVRHILTGGRHLLDLVNEVLNISRIESGQMELSLEAVSVAGLCRETVDLLRPLADQRNIRIAGLPPDLRVAPVQADPQRLKQVLLNLLSNAIKYNRPGGAVRVRCTTEGTRLRLSVSDTGTGIAAHKLPHLFKPFERLGQDLNAVEGTGLGLALSKRLTELMGGTLAAESTLGEGSQFTVDLAIAEESMDGTVIAGDAAKAEPAVGVEAQHTVLYIEDHFANLQLIDRLLARRPAVRLIPILQATLGRDIVAQHRPDLILLDLDLPDMNGREVLLRVRESVGTSKIPIVVLSADATTGQVKRFLGDGATAHLMKPVEVARFFETIDELLGEAPACHGEAARV